MHTIDNIIIISPDYAENIKKLTDNYVNTEFYIFSSSRIALSEFKMVPIQFTKGICFINDSLDDIELKSLKKFLKLYDLSIAQSKNKLILICSLSQPQGGKLSSQTRVKTAVSHLNSNSYEIYYYNYKTLNDQIVMQVNIGSILLIQRGINFRPPKKINYENPTNYLTIENIYLEEE